ncbi:hypothetical protein Hte_000970 [Hypoxylon texense]
MPSVTPFQPLALTPSKKRRRDDDHSEVQVPLYASPQSSLWSWSANRDVGSRSTQSDTEPQNLLCPIDNNERLILPPTSGWGGEATSVLNMPRKVIPVPVSKRFRVFNENEEHHQQHMHQLSHHHSQQPLLQQPLLQQSHLFHGHSEYSTPPDSPQDFPTTIIPKSVNPAALLSPCHICHRKPTKRSDLDSFADCLGCGQRACFVCIRECQGWLPPTFPSNLVKEEQSLSSSFTMTDADGPSPGHELGGFYEGWSGRGHRAMICSRCCVERGSEGDVVCLGCLAWMEGT